MLLTFKVDPQRYKYQQSMINISTTTSLSIVSNEQPPIFLDPAITHEHNIPSTRLYSFIPNPHPINNIFYLYGPSPTLRSKFDSSHIITDDNTITDNKQYTTELDRLLAMVNELYNQRIH